ncbi:hypothetical protein D7W09_01290 [bacterium D16-34]|nr:hypothetical protein D7W09_01290 [bacterium D16-34]
MLHVYEFEIFKSDSGLYLVFPFDLEGGTQGESFEDACKMVASGQLETFEYEGRVWVSKYSVSALKPRL